MAHAVFVRSTTRTRDLTSVDPAAALAIPGVVAVITGADVQDALTGPMVLLGRPT